MAIALKNTREVSTERGVKILVHGVAGAGKTSLIKTLENPIVLSAESGLLALQDHDIPYLEIKTLDDLMEAYEWITNSKDASGFETVCLDSISEIAEVVLAEEKKTAKDPRQAYGAMQDQMSQIVRAFRDLEGFNVYFSAKTERTTDDTGRLLWGPMMPGNKMAQALPYFFDEVFALRVEKNEAGENMRAIQTDNDGIWSAKDRSGRLDFWEGADLGAIILKIKGGAVEQ